MRFTLSDLAIFVVVLAIVIFACRRLIARGSAWLVGPLILGMLGAGCFCLAAADAWTSWRLVHGNRHAPGIVIGIEISDSTDSSSDPDHPGIVHNGVIRKPVVRFRPQESEREVEFTAQGNKGGGTDYSVGDKVNVLYAPEQPERARLDIFGDLWLPALILLVAGIVLGSAAWGMWLLWRKVGSSRLA